ncbi:3-deoxy-D-manno-octulosonic acid kinase [Vibrio agarivorans]|uniref:3-deoxy-D-manno-octulosonic acid kinase n=1 Tax=Vibrio agarivorans TaxID=153622 RepID=UPI0025B2F0F8|nr:3-deoxy-D-manno-octulosonic acid kinase [Vibrio agarivorans]MDN3662174.1 3-deoxy-D-manno-octulosonic acid kinase [Vibrio agarivorans]
MFNLVQHNNVTYYFDPKKLSVKVEDAFNIEFWRRSNLIMGSATGRGTTWFVKEQSNEFAIRHYYRGGLLGKVVRDSYLYLGMKKTRSVAELNALEQLKKSNVNVPSPIAAKVTRHGLFYKTDIITQKIHQSSALVDRLQREVMSADIYQRIGQEIKKMHQAGVNHTDLNCHNILIDSKQTVWLIDFDNCRIELGNSSWKQSNLKRLLRSFKKEQSRKGIKFELSDWQHLLTGYGVSSLSDV